METTLASYRPAFQSNPDVVLAFKAAWDAGSEPKLEDYLVKISDSDRPLILRELLAVEIHALQEAGIKPSRGDYESRFPGHLDLVDQLISAHRSFDGTTASTATYERSEAKPAVADGRPLPTTGERYRYVQLLGRGGFGEVWRAYDERLGREVALKVPRRDRAFSQQALDAFIAEARKGAKLREICQRVVHVLDVHDDGGSSCIVMELMKGGSLADKIKEGPLPAVEAARLVAEIAEILSSVHRASYVHRDIKPANILFDEFGNPFLADLGLAATEQEQLDEPDMALGTLLYMPLEQAEQRSNRTDGRADIYSLGVVFYQLLTGRLPYLARNRAEYIRRMNNPDGPKPPRQVNSDIPLELERICLRCIQANARDRYQTAADVTHELRRWQQSAAKVRLRRPSVLVSAAAAAAALALAYAVTLAVPSHDSGRVDFPTIPFQEETPKPHEDSQIVVAEEPVFYVTPLLFPEDAGSSWMPADYGMALHVSSSYASLLGFAEVERGANCDLSVDLYQVDWPGRAGVFVGHRVDARGNASCEVIELQKWDGIFSWKRSIRTYSGQGSNLEIYVLAQQTIRVPEDGPKTLSIRITRGTVTDIAFDGRSLDELLAIRPADRPRVEDCSGRVGVYNMRSSAVFSKVTVDGNRLELRKQTR